MGRLYITVICTTTGLPLLVLPSIGYETARRRTGLVVAMIAKRVGYKPRLDMRFYNPAIHDHLLVREHLRPRNFLW